MTHPVRFLSRMVFFRYRFLVFLRDASAVFFCTRLLLGAYFTVQIRDDFLFVDRSFPRSIRFNFVPWKRLKSLRSSGVVCAR